MNRISRSFRKHLNRKFSYVGVCDIDGLKVILLVDNGEQNKQRLLIRVVYRKYGFVSIRYQFIECNEAHDRNFLSGFIQSSYFQLSRYLPSGNGNFLEDLEEYKIDLEVISGMQKDNL